MPFLTHAGVSLRYDRTGSGPPVLLVHGWTCNRTFWSARWSRCATGTPGRARSPLAEPLASPTREAATIDPPNGRGRSYIWRAPRCSSRRHRRSCRAMVRRLAVGRAAAVDREPHRVPVAQRDHLASQKVRLQVQPWTRSTGRAAALRS